jgi:glycine/serine hydroxymethyltransferase
MTTRGMGEAEMVQIAGLIDDALTRRDEAALLRVRHQVEELTARFPLYPTDFGAHRSSDA